MSEQRSAVRLERDGDVAEGKVFCGGADVLTPEMAGPILMSEDAGIGIRSLLEHGPGGQPRFTGR